MDLPNLLTKLKSGNEELQKFVAIEIGFDTVKVALWQSTGSHTEVTSIGSTQSWTSTDPDELLSAIDTSYADAQGSIIEEPDKVIYGLPETWVDKNGIAESFKPLLKSICKKFNFHPIGFVVTTEAIVHHLRDIEGGPPSAILLQIYSHELAVSLIYLGQLEATQVVDRSTSLTADIEEGLGRIPHTGHLPSRIIFLTNQDDPEPVKQELISYDWQKKLSFLHMPKVETLPKEWSIKAVAIAGGAEVISATGLNTKVTPPPIPEPDPEPTLDPEVETETNPEPLPPTSPDMGFKAIDLSAKTPAPILTAPPKPSLAEIDNLELPEPEITQPPRKNLLIGLKQGTTKFMGKLKFPTIKIPSFSSNFVLPLIILGVLVVIGIGAFIAYRTFPQAEIDAYVDMKSYQQQINFVLDPDVTQANYDSNLLPGIKSTQEISGSKTIATTGTRLVGDRAKGKIILYNRTQSPRTFKAGTTLKAKNLKFTLDTAVTVASASSKENSDFSLTIEPSKAESLATAADIGDQYNLPKDTQFTVDNYATDTFFAVANDIFSGGSSKSVSAVATADISNLKTELIKELQTGLATKSSTDSGAQVSQISVGEPEIVKEEYSAEKNEEAAELTLNLSLSQSVYQYNSADLSVIAQQSAVKSLPENSQIKPDSTTVNIISTTIDDQDKATVTADIVLYYIQRINSDEYAKELVGIPVNDLPTKLSLLPGYLRYELTPKYLIFNRLPINQNQISLRVRTETSETVTP